MLEKMPESVEILFGLKVFARGVAVFDRLLGIMRAIRFIYNFAPCQGTWGPKKIIKVRWRRISVKSSQGSLNFISKHPSFIGQRKRSRRSCPFSDSIFSKRNKSIILSKMC